MPKKLIFGIFIAIIINFIQAVFTPITEDEAYYWVWSQNLDCGYFDHPPMVAWWISAGYSLFQNELGVRLFSVLFNGISFFLLWKILEPKNRNQENLFWAIFGSVLVIQAFGFLSTPDAPLLFFTILYIFSLKGFLEKNTYFFCFLLSISFAGLMYSKYHGVLVLLFTLVPILTHLWKNPKFYLAILASLILYVPHIVWLIQHEFSPISYHFLERSVDEEFEFRKLGNFIGIVAMGCSPFLSYYVIKSLVKFKPNSSFEKSMWWLAICPVGFFFLAIFKDNVQPQWLLISFVGMALVAYFYNERQGNSKLLIQLGFMGIVFVLIFRIILITPSISPLMKYKEFALNAGKLTSENIMVEKYQEASLIKFYNPEKKVAVHRTLGNRKSQYHIWDWENDFYGKTIQYVSPWVKSNSSFIGLKNRNYHIKEISNYLPFDLVSIETEKTIHAKPNQKINLKIIIRNGHQHPIHIGENSQLNLNINYYQSLQYEILYKSNIPIKELNLEPNEEKEFEISFQNCENTGEYNVNLGLNYAPIGTTYVSNTIRIVVD